MSDKERTVQRAERVVEWRERFDRTPPGERIPGEAVAWAEADRLRDALQAIRRLWTHPAPAQRQDVAYQAAVRIASEALDDA